MSTRARKAAARKSPDELIQERRKKRLKRWQEFVDRPETLEEICIAISEGDNIAAWCRRNDFPYMTVSDWLHRVPQKSRYDTARELRGDKMFEDIMTMANRKPKDQVDAMHQRLQVSTYQWAAQRLNRFYADRVQMALTGKDDGPIEHSHSVKTLTDAELEDIARRGRDRAAAEKTGKN